MSKILINQSAINAVLSDVGVTIVPGQAYTIPPQDYARFAGSSDVIRKLASGQLAFSDGSNDNVVLSDAVNILKNWCRSA